MVEVLPSISNYFKRMFSATHSLSINKSLFINQHWLLIDADVVAEIDNQSKVLIL